MNRILFVDDERPLLEGLRGRLQRLGTRWDMAFVEGGSQAIEAFERDPYDVIVTDMRMPEMDGAQLLQTVSERWPETIRIVLSGYADLQQTIRLVPVAHQYLSKPCEVQRLENVIERCLQLHGLLRAPDLRAIVGRIRALPSMPRTYSRLREAMRDEDVAVKDIAALISGDTAIAARVLQMVNSAFFRLARRITNIEQAVTYLGFTAIRNVALSAEIFSQWSGALPEHFDPGRLQDHVQSVAGATHALTSGGPLADDALLAALLHDIGYWVLAQECPEELTAAVNTAVKEKMCLHEAETCIIGASHAEIGAYLLGIWGLPYNVIEAVAHHHSPARVHQTEFDVLAAVAVAHALAPVPETDAFDVAVPPNPAVGADYLAGLHAPFDWDEAVRLAGNRTGR